MADEIKIVPYACATLKNNVKHAEALLKFLNPKDQKPAEVMCEGYIPETGECKYRLHWISCGVDKFQEGKFGYDYLYGQLREKLEQAPTVKRNIFGAITRESQTAIDKVIVQEIARMKQEYLRNQDRKCSAAEGFKLAR